MKTVLQFSGGRDSLSALFLMEPFWDGVTVAWLDSGDSAPELHALMDRVRNLVPHFVRIEGHAPQRRLDMGDPTPDNWLDCCGDSIWKPMREWVSTNQVRWVIRGTRKVDPLAWPLPQSEHDGIIYMLPLWDWTDDFLRGVLVNIKERGFAPVYPHDCLTCPVSRVCDRPELRNVA